MKLALLGSVFAFGAVSVANAADVYAPDSIKDEIQVYAPITWAGFYVGGHMGSTFDSEFDDEQRGSLELDEALNAGAHFGYNWQTPSNWVYGIEADVGGVDDDVTDYVATIRGRLGYAFGSSLVYGTAGGAWVGYDDAFAIVNGIDDTAFGLVVGGGLEHKLTNKLSLGVESLYYSVSGDDEIVGDDFDQDFWSVRARATYHFGQRYEEPLK